MLYVASAPFNPVPFDSDESRVAYNACTIAQSRRDEHGLAWPLYFRGEPSLDEAMAAR